MMKLIYKSVLMLFLLMGTVNVDVQAKITPVKKTEYTKSVKKEFDMNKNGEVDLINKYGNINLVTWSSNKVKIDVTITVNARSESSANDIFDRINIDFSNSSSFVKAETIIESSNKSSWWGSGDKADFRIDYQVSIPDAASLNLNNKYGDSKISGIGGDADIVVKYGNFNLESVSGNTNINLGYGNGSIGKTNEIGVDVKYSKIELKEASLVDIESKYSKIYINKATRIKSESKYDNYDLGELIELRNQGKYDHFEIEAVEKITALSKYTHFKINELSRAGEFDLRYGGVKIENLLKGFDDIFLDCEYTECKIYMDDNVDFVLDAVGDYSSIHYPSGMNVKYEKQKSSNHEVQGHRGSASSGKIKVRLSHGGLKIK